MNRFVQMILFALTICILSLFSTGICAEDRYESLWQEAIIQEDTFAPLPIEQEISNATSFIVNEEDNSITYINPSETIDKNINVYLKFDDVSKDVWYEWYLSHLVQLGIINGMDDKTFAPNAYITRAQFATMLAYAANANLTLYQGISSFRDVETDAWYAPQVEWAYQEGLIQGRGEGFFCPECYLTREEAAVLTDRYAEITKSPILDMYQYELIETGERTLSSEEKQELKAMLADPIFEDQNEISDWAEEEVASMNKAGIICGDETHNFNPQQYLRRSECAKIISVYLINDKKPTFYFPGGSYIEYIWPEEESILTEEEMIEGGILEPNGKVFHGPNMVFESEDSKIDNEPESTEITLKWGRNTHNTIIDKAFVMLSSSRNYINIKMNSDQFTDGYNGKSYNGITSIKYYNYYTDVMENQSGKFYSHFYNPDTGKSYNGSTTTNAYRYFNNHFYNAYTGYRSGSVQYAYREMGMSLHYYEDLNNPYHANNKTTDTTNHKAYETWANDIAPSVNVSMTYDSYRYMYDASFLDISNNSANAAQDQYLMCASFAQPLYEDEAIVRTKNLIAHTERGVTGLLNRFYYVGWLNH